METKRTHFKMYKIGRRWAFACATLLVLGGATVTANAAENAESSNSSSSSNESTAKVTASATSTSSSSQVLKASAKTDSTSQSQSSQSSSTSSSDVSSSDVSSSESSKQSSQSKTQKDSTEGTQVTSAKKVQSAPTDNDNQKQQPADTQTTTTTSSSDTQKQATVTSDKATNTATTSDVSKVSAASVNLPKAANFGAFKSSLKANAAVKANDAVQDGGSVYDDYPDLNNILGISSQFHIFAREAELNAHTNGNLAVQNLIGNVNFGTSIIEELLDKDISYIQNITNIANSSFVSNGATRTNKVIFGEGIEIDISNPNRPMVNGTYIDHLLAEEVYQDKNGLNYSYLSKKSSVFMFFKN